MDLTEVLAAYTSGNTAIATIGALSLAMVVGIMVWRRLRGAA